MLALCFCLGAPLNATIQVQVGTSPASPQVIGTVITWTASANDSNSGPVTYKFEVAMPGANKTYATVSDFSLTNTLNWTPNIVEGN